MNPSETKMHDWRTCTCACATQAFDKHAVAAETLSRQTRKVGGFLKNKGKYLQDRTAIDTELTRLENAELSTWAPYAVLRKPLESSHASSHDGQQTEALKTGSPGRSPAGQSHADPHSPDRMSIHSPDRDKMSVPPTPGGMSVMSPVGSMGQTDRDVGGERDTVTPQTAGKKKKKQNILDSWKLDPMQSRTGEPDLALDDSRLVPAPGWARARALHSLQVMAPEHDDEVLAAALQRLTDPEGMVRLAAVRAIRKLAKRGDRSSIDAVAALVAGKVPDPVANVRKEVCVTLGHIGDRGLEPSQKLQLTGTKRDLIEMQRDKKVIDTITPLLTDSVASVRTAAQEALDTINPGWQRWGVNETRLDDSHLAHAATRRPLKVPPPPRYLGSLDEKLWHKTYTTADLRQKEEKWQHKDEFKGGKVSGVTLEKNNARYHSLAGYKYVSYNDKLRQAAQVRRFEEAQERAAAKTQEKAIHFAAQGSRQISTQWMGIEWVDRTQRTFLGNVLHPMGAGVEAGGPHQVHVPYTAGYNAFGTPMGYKYI